MVALTKPVLNTKVDNIKIDEVTPLVDYIIAIFGSKQRADLWLRSPNANLQGKTPKQAIRSKSGRVKINGMMLRVEHGIF